MKFTNIKQLIIKFMGGGIINFPTRFLRWVKITGDTDDSDDGGGGGSGSMSMYDAWMKAFRNLQNEDCPVKPKKVVRGWFGNYVNYGTTDNTINLDFCNKTTNVLYTEEGATIYDIENVPDDIYNTEDYCFATFLYDLDELNQFENVSKPIQQLFNDYDGIPNIRIYGNTLGKFNSNVISIDGKYYVWFQDWD